MRSVKMNFLGSLLLRRQFSTKIGIVGAPYKYGTTHNLGVERAPGLLRDHDLAGKIVEFNENVDIKDFGDVVTSEPVVASDGVKLPENMHHYDRFMPTMQRLSEKIGEVRRDGRICVTLGGDHAIAVGRFSWSDLGDTLRFECFDIFPIRLFEAIRSLNV